MTKDIKNTQYTRGGSQEGAIRKGAFPVLQGEGRLGFVEYDLVWKKINARGRAKRLLEISAHDSQLWLWRFTSGALHGAFGGFAEGRFALK